MANNDAPDVRRETILGWLKEQPLLSIDDLAQRLNVSTMTIYRDIEHLSRLGLVQRLLGAVRLALPATQTAVCRLCGRPPGERSKATLHLKGGEVLEMCCPHCALIGLGQVEGVVSALVQDFLYARAINMLQAVYLVESEVQLCCVPSVLCFATESDAMRFQNGFGGLVMNFQQAQYTLRNQHSPHHSH